MTKEEYEIISEALKQAEKEINESFENYTIKIRELREKNENN